VKDDDHERHYGERLVKNVPERKKLLAGIENGELFEQTTLL
jgi:hypothetical protein